VHNVLRLAFEPTCHLGHSCTERISGKKCPGHFITVSSRTKGSGNNFRDGNTEVEEIVKHSFRTLLGGLGCCCCSVPHLPNVA